MKYQGDRRDLKVEEAITSPFFIKHYERDKNECTMEALCQSIQNSFCPSSPNNSLDQV